MPVYEYECEKCGNRFELIATLAEKEAGIAPECPKCGSQNCRQVFGRVNVITSARSEDSFDDDYGAGDDFDAGDGGYDDDSFGDESEPDYLD